MIQRILLAASFAFVVLCHEIELSAADDCKGCVQLDEYSFNKVIPKYAAALVKFDVAFPYGERHEQFGKVAYATKDSMDLLVAEVGVKDFGNQDNSELAKRYGISKNDYPTVLLFLQGRNEPFRFKPEREEDFTADNLKRFVKSKSSVYLGLPGCVEQLDKLAEEFKTADEKGRQEILKKAKLYEDTLPEEQQAAAKVYVKMMERIVEKGNVFVQIEQTRLEGLLKGKLSKEKKRNMEERRNILHSFSHRDEL